MVAEAQGLSVRITRDGCLAPALRMGPPALSGLAVFSTPRGCVFGVPILKEPDRRAPTERDSFMVDKHYGFWHCLDPVRASTRNGVGRRCADAHGLRCVVGK